MLFGAGKTRSSPRQPATREPADALMKLAILTALTACRVMQLVRARDGRAPQAACDLFEPGQIELLTVLQLQYEGRTARQKNPHPPATLAWAAWLIARLGAWHGYNTSET